MAGPWVQVAGARTPQVSFNFVIFFLQPFFRGCYSSRLNPRLTRSECPVWCVGRRRSWAATLLRFQMFIASEGSDYLGCNVRRPMLRIPRVQSGNR